MEVTRTFNKATTLYFPLIDAGAADFESTPVTHASGDTQVSIDGGAFNNTGSGFSHEGNGIYSLPITAAETQGSVIVVTIIDQTSPKAWEDQCVIINTALGPWAEGGQGIIIGIVEDTDDAPTTTTFEAFRLSPNVTEEATAGHMNGRIITFTSGILLGQQTDITDYALANSKEFYTVSTLTEAPGDGDRFVVT